MAENDFLHSLLSKITASKGDSGGQGEVHYFLKSDNKEFQWSFISYCSHFRETLLCYACNTTMDTCTTLKLEANNHDLVAECRRLFKLVFKSIGC